MKGTRKVRTGIVICLLAGVIGCSGSDEPAVSNSALGSSKVVRKARMVPDDLRANSVVEVAFSKAAKPEQFSYVWYRNGDPIAGATGHRLDPHYFVRGDRLSVEVVAESGERFRTPEKEVMNSPPNIIHASAAIQGGGNGGEVVAQVDARDVDNDNVRYTYRWFRNAKPIEGASGPSIGMDQIEKGDVVYAEVVASDNMSQSAAFRTEVVTIDNHPPQILSEPGAPKGGEFVYQLDVQDEDLDRLSYTLVDAPEGMTIDSNGLLRWQLPTGDDRKGSHRVTIQVTDTNGGLATQSFSITF